MQLKHFQAVINYGHVIKEVEISHTHAIKHYTYLIFVYDKK